MSELKTQIGRKKRAEAVALGTTLAKVTHLAIGRGGLSADGVTPKTITGTATVLFDEIKRKPVVVTKIDDYRYQFEASFDATTTDADLIGDTINEAGLIDEDGDFIFLQTFNLFAASLPANFKDKHIIVVQFI